MLPGKRRLQGGLLERRVRPRKHDDDSDIDVSKGFSDSDDRDEPQEPEGEDIGSSSVDDSELDEEIGQPEEKPSLDLSSVSFGDLAEAQAGLPPSSSRRIKEATTKQALGKWKPPTKDAGSDDSEESEDEDDGPTKGRSSKHAPMEISSKKAVSRRRVAVEVPKRPPRDPRFDPLSGPLDEARFARAYAFLDDYRASEMADLRRRIRKEKNPAAKEPLQRELMAMESRKKDRERRADEQRILEEHRAQEKELVKQGKKPFYLKKSEQKKRLLVDKFAGMKKRQVDRVIQRKRKKVAAKEKRELDSLQRVRSRD